MCLRKTYEGVTGDKHADICAMHLNIFIALLASVIRKGVPYLGYFKMIIQGKDECEILRKIIPKNIKRKNVHTCKKCLRKDVHT